MARLPGAYEAFRKRHKDIAEAYDRLGEAAAEAGPLDPKTRELVKLGIALGAGLEGAVHSHVRRALEAGAKPEEIRHAALLALTTAGFPSMMSGLTWVDDVLGAGPGRGQQRPSVRRRPRK